MSEQTVSAEEILATDPTDPTGPEQLELEALPTMGDLDALQVELDGIDRVLADLG